jgi:hypothetical protein
MLGSLALAGFVLIAPNQGRASILPFLCDTGSFTCYNNGVYNSTYNTFYYEGGGDDSSSAASTDGTGLIPSYTENLTGTAASIADGIVGPTWTYNYMVEIGSDETTSPAVPSFFTIYDIAGYVTGSAAQDSTAVTTTNVASVTEQPTGVNPGCCTVVPDSPSLPNLTFYTNVTLTGPEDDDGIAFESTLAPALLGQGWYTYQSYNTSSQGTDQGSGNVLIPTATPEPSTMAMLGGAMFGLGLLRRRTRNNHSCASSPSIIG